MTCPEGHITRATLAALGALLLGCIPEESPWVVTTPRFRGVQVEVVEPGGYASLLDVPPGRRRATALPLDTVELTWQVTAPAKEELPPPLWIACADCLQSSNDLLSSLRATSLAGLSGCPDPLPLALAGSCRLGEGHRIRVGLGGAFTDDPELAHPTILVVGSRRADLAPATCLERLAAWPIEPAQSCLFGLDWIAFGPTWAALPFAPETSRVPPEIRDQEVDTHPDLVAFAVTRARGDDRVELVADPGEDVPVRRGERVTVAPIFAEGSAQTYWTMVGGEEGVPWSGTPEPRQERLEWRTWFSAPVEAHTPNWDGWGTDLSWVVPHDVAPTTLYLDIRDDRAGTAFAELRFVEDPAR